MIDSFFLKYYFLVSHIFYKFYFSKVNRLSNKISAKKMSKKQNVLKDLYLNCKKQRKFTFDNEDVKEFCKKHNFGNPFDVTKIDNTNILPDVMKKDDAFIVHLGKGGKHKFIKGISKGYHEFEKNKRKRYTRLEV